MYAWARPTPGMDVRIVPIHDEPIESWSEDLALPQGEIGEIVVRGAVVTPSYYKRPQATKLAKIPTENGDIWHRMGDVGYFDEQGRLWMCGRKGHRVGTETGTLYTICCEAVFNTHPAVRRSALVSVMREGMTTPLLCVERVKGVMIENGRLTQELLEIARSHEHTRAIGIVLYPPLLSGRCSPQRQDLSREAGGVGQQTNWRPDAGRLMDTHS